MKNKTIWCTEYPLMVGKWLKIASRYVRKKIMRTSFPIRYPPDAMVVDSCV
jgi:hypothetical protein